MAASIANEVPGMAHLSLAFQGFIWQSDFGMPSDVLFVPGIPRQQD